MRVRVRDLVVDLDEVVAYSRFTMEVPIQAPQGVLKGAHVMRTEVVALYLRGLSQPIVIQFNNDKDRDKLFEFLLKKIPPNVEFGGSNATARISGYS